MGVGSWVMMVGKFSSPGSQGEHQNSSDSAAGWGLGSGRDMVTEAPVTLLSCTDLLEKL